MFTLVNTRYAQRYYRLPPHTPKRSGVIVDENAGDPDEGIWVRGRHPDTNIEPTIQLERFYRRHHHFGAMRFVFLR